MLGPLFVTFGIFEIPRIRDTGFTRSQLSGFLFCQKLSMTKAHQNTPETRENTRGRNAYCKIAQLLFKSNQDCQNTSHYGEGGEF